VVDEKGYFWKMICKRKFEKEIDDDSIVLVCVARDELLLLPYFIKHYVRLGVTHFIFIDNDSTDGTLEYLINYENLEFEVYYTKDSYAENNYGIEWVNKLLNDKCKDKWCIVVDVDELLMPNHHLSLEQIRNNMVRTNTNIAVACLLDFYPRDFNSELYKSEQSFLEHSNFYDKMEMDKIFMEIQDDDAVTIKGGLRHRITTDEKPNNDSHCLTKKSFFKYDFYGLYKLSVGMHWIVPFDFVDWEDAEDKWKSAPHKLKFYSQMLILGHFKYLKPNVFDHFKERVRRNQDWAGSVEYKKYVDNERLMFFDSDVSMEYGDTCRVYQNTIDNVYHFLTNTKRLQDKEFIIIISGQRHGSTTLCEKINELPNTISMFEVFATTGKFYADSYENMESHLTRLINGTSWLANTKHISFKVFHNHNVELDELLKLDVPKKVIFLKRNLKDSYDSWRKSLLTGNWGTNPKVQQTGDGITEYSVSPHKILKYNEYATSLKNWFSYALRKVEKHNIVYKEVRFSDVVNEKFDIKKLLD